MTQFADRISLLMPTSRPTPILPPPAPDSRSVTVPNRAKFLPPFLNLQTVPRTRSLRMFEQANVAPIMLLLAPAGYGKSTLMRQHMAQIVRSGQSASWLTIDAADNDPARLMCYLHCALRDWLVDALHLEGIIEESNTDWLTMLEQVDPEAPQLTLFLDELEKLSSQASVQLIKSLVDRMPRAVRLVFGSRVKPALSLERQRVRGELRILAADELRFDREETEQFFRQAYDVALPAPLIGQIHITTQGWPAALQLTALAAPTRQQLEQHAHDMSGSLANVANYLTEEVLNAQTQEVRTFLLQTCCLPQLGTLACNAATGRSDSHRILQFLELHGLFITRLDESQGWYRYQPLFAQFLCEQAATALPREQRLAGYCSAAAWFAGQGMPIEAVDLWLLAGDGEAAILEMSKCVHELLRQAQFGTILRWFGSLGDTALAVADAPELMLAVAWSYGFSGRGEAALRLVDQIRSVLAADPARRNLYDELQAFEAVLMGLRGEIACAIEHGMAHWERIRTRNCFANGALANLLSYCHVLQGDFASAMRYFHHARLSNEKIGSALGLGYAFCVAGMVEAIQGNLSGALAKFREVDAVAGKARGQPWFDTTHIKVASAGLIASILYEQDRLDQADELLRCFLPLAQRQPSIDMLLVSQVTLARIRLAQGELDDALDILDRTARDIGGGRQLDSAYRVVQWERVRIDLTGGRIDAALARADMLERTDGDAATGEWRWFAEELGCGAIETIRCAIARGDTVAAMASLEQEVERADEQGHRWRLLKLILLRALAFDAMAQSGAALAELVRALELGWRIGARRSFADQGLRIGVLLSDIDPRRFDMPPALTAYLLTLRGAAPDIAPVRNKLALNGREQAIVELLAVGKSNEFIARHLFLSVNTVKWHIRRLLEKLDARNRNEAVFLARQCGILDSA